MRLEEYLTAFTSDILTAFYYNMNGEQVNNFILV
jgi:hypothetical protein